MLKKVEAYSFDGINGRTISVEARRFASSGDIMDLSIIEQAIGSTVITMSGTGFKDLQQALNTINPPMEAADTLGEAEKKYIRGMLTRAENILGDAHDCRMTNVTVEAIEVLLQDIATYLYETKENK